MWLSQGGWRISQSQDLRIYTLVQEAESQSNYLQKMTEEPLWRVMRNGKYAEQKEKEKTASRFVPEISLVRCAHLFDFRYYQLVRKIPYGQTFHEVFSIDWIVITALDSSSVYDISTIFPWKFNRVNLRKCCKFTRENVVSPLSSGSDRCLIDDFFLSVSNAVEVLMWH